MGARQSKRSVDITTTPKKGDGDSPVIEGEGKVKEIGEVDPKVTTNGTVHTEVESNVSLSQALIFPLTVDLSLSKLLKSPVSTLHAPSSHFFALMLFRL